MKLREYLEKLDLSATDFANSSRVKRGTICHILAGGGCHAKAAAKIIASTHGLVTLEDLAGDVISAETSLDV